MEKMEEKLWGVYNTFDNPETFETLEEIDIWKKINNLGGAIFWAMHDSGKPWAADVSKKDLIDAQYNLEYLVYSTRRFGVEFSKEPSATEHVERSEYCSCRTSIINNHACKFCSIFSINTIFFWFVIWFSCSFTCSKSKKKRHKHRH